MDLPPAAAARARLASIDVLRGIVMVIMALDHVRDYVSGAEFSPDDVAHTTLPYFFTRWITHFCAPTFCFLAGLAVFLSRGRRTRRSLAVLLVTRGLWLICAELTIIRFAWSFQLDAPLRFMVIWMLGASMIVLAALIYLPRWAIAVVSLVMSAGHNLLDVIPAAPLVGPHPLGRVPRVARRRGGALPDVPLVRRRQGAAARCLAELPLSPKGTLPIKETSDR